MASKPERTLPNNTDELLYVKLTKKGVTKYCGYREDYLSQNLTEMEQELIVCKECIGIMREPSIYNGNTTCLVCSERPELNSVKGIQNSVSKLNIKCPLLRDCSWNGNLSEADHHLNTCVHFLIECAKCKQILPRGETDTHKVNLCAMREIKCDFCGKNGIPRELDNHLTFCLEYLISCPNNCGERFPRKDSSKHESECQLQLIECPFAKYGCRAKSMLRRDLLAHKKDNLVEHTDFSLDRIDKLENENIRLIKDKQNKMEWELKLNKRLDGVEWEIENVNTLEAGQTIEGPTFYVNNYKLKVYATILRHLFPGMKMLNFFLERVKGEFDRNLTEAFVTNYRMITVDKQDYKKSTYLDGSMNYQLKIGSESRCFKQIHYSLYSTSQDDTLLVRFYFDTNTQPLLTSMEARQQYSLSHKIRHEPVDPFKECFKSLYYEALRY